MEKEPIILTLSDSQLEVETELTLPVVFSVITDISKIICTIRLGESFDLIIKAFKQKYRFK